MNCFEIIAAAGLVIVLLITGCAQQNALLVEEQPEADNATTAKAVATLHVRNDSGNNDSADNSSVAVKAGCRYNNPPCAANSSCISNTCIPKGCKYDNPSCNSSQVCQNNKCFERVFGTGY